MFYIKTLNKISKIGLDCLDENYKCNDDIDNPDAVLVRSYNMHDLELGDALKAVARAGAGVNNIPIDKYTKQGVVVFNTPGANANAVKELTIASLLLSSRKIVEGIEWVKTLKNTDEEVLNLVEKEKSRFKGPEIYGKTLGVIGLGAIGVMVANAAIGLGMEVQGFDPYISVDSAWGLSRDVKRAADLTSLYSTSDFISIHVPLGVNTKNMIGKEEFELMKKGTRLINVSRDGIVNRKDLLEAMDKGIIAKYVSDFPREEIVGHENVIAIPHLGASTPESEENCAFMAVKQLKDFLEDGTIVNSVNYPTCELPRSSDYRITISNENVPNMVGQISTILANANYNIINMINKSKGNIAYTIIDVDREVDENMLNEFRNRKGILNVRLI
jgi:D-3-phosphoglycerate dehydrogenase